MGCGGRVCPFPPFIFHVVAAGAYVVTLWCYNVDIVTLIVVTLIAVPPSRVVLLAGSVHAAGGYCKLGRYILRLVVTYSSVKYLPE